MPYFRRFGILIWLTSEALWRRKTAGLECNSSCNRCCLLPRENRFPWKSVQPKPRTALRRRLRTAISGYVLRLDSGDDTAEVISQWAASALQGKALWLMEDDTAKISGENNWILSESPLANET